MGSIYSCAVPWNNSCSFRSRLKPVTSATFVERFRSIFCFILNKLQNIENEIMRYVVKWKMNEWSSFITRELNTLHGHTQTHTGTHTIPSQETHSIYSCHSSMFWMRRMLVTVWSGTVASNLSCIRLYSELPGVTWKTHNDSNNKLMY